MAEVGESVQVVAAERDASESRNRLLRHKKGFSIPSNTKRMDDAALGDVRALPGGVAA